MTTSNAFETTSIPQANNMFSLKNLLQIFVTPNTRIEAKNTEALFENTRAQQYYLAAAKSTLQWIKVAPKKGNQNKGWVLTKQGKKMRALAENDQDFCTEVHKRLMENTWYKAVNDHGTDEKAMNKLVQSLSSESKLEITTSARRISSFVSWNRDLTAGMAGDAQKLAMAKQRAIPNSRRQLLAQEFKQGKALYATREMEVRMFQQAFRKDCLELYGNKCLLSGVNLSGLLVASHIKPASVCEDNEAVDPANSLLLEARFDKLFDQGFISFTNDGFMLFSESIESEMKNLMLHQGMKLTTLLPASKRYLAYHRANVFKN